MVFVCVLIKVVEFVIVVRVILSWLQWEDKNQFTRKVVDLSEPILAPVRKLVPPLGNGIDISPIVIFLVLIIVRSFLC